MLQNVLNFIYSGEPLEFDIKSQLKDEKNKRYILLKILLLKIFRITYKNLQRSILRPSIRNIFIFIESLFFINFKKNNHYNTILEAKKLKENAFLEVDNIFTDKQIDEIRSFLSDKYLLEPIYSDHENFYLNNKPPGIKTGYFQTKNLIKCPHIFEGANNEKILSILSNYFGCKFKLDWVWAWWSFPSNEKAGPQLFHRDYESFNFIKLFVYLTDVDENSGPHEIIKESHNDNTFYKRKRFSDKDISDNFKKNNCIKIHGKSGKSFLANTFAIHKGHHPKKNDRLVLVYLYSVVSSNRSPKLSVIKKQNLNSNLKKIISKNIYVNKNFIN